MEEVIPQHQSHLLGVSIHGTENDAPITNVELEETVMRNASFSLMLEYFRLPRQSRLLMN
jgi:hypothetical protein